MLYEPAFVAVTGWFGDVRNRARALLVITLMGGLASSIFLPFTAALLARTDWPLDGVKGAERIFRE